MRFSIKNATVGKYHRDWQKDTQMMMNDELLGLGLITKADIKKQSRASDKQVDAYVKCMDAIDDGDLKTTIVDGYTKSTPSATVKKVNKATTECGKKLGR